MDTYEFEFPGGSAVVTTTTDGTKEAPAICLKATAAPITWDVEEVLAAEILKLATKAEALEAETDAARFHARIYDLNKMNANLNLRIRELEAERGVLRDRVTTLERAFAVLEAENSRLRLSDARLTSLRLEVDERGKRIAHLETIIRGHETNTRLFRARIDALIAEARNLRTDLAAAIKTGEEQASRIKGHDDAWAIDQRIKRNLMERIATLDLRLSRLDALLSSEAVPEGLRRTIGTLTPVLLTDYAEAAWRWFREQLWAKHS